MDYRANLSSREIQVHLKSTSKLKETPSGDATITRLDKFNVKQDLSLKMVDPQLVLFSRYPSLTHTIQVYALMWSAFVVFTT